MEDFYGEDEAAKAREMMNAAYEETKIRVRRMIASHKQVFDEKSEDEKRDALALAENNRLRHIGEERIELPALRVEQMHAFKVKTMARKW